MDTRCFVSGMLRVQHDWETSFRVDLQPFWVNSLDAHGKLTREGHVKVFKDGDHVRSEPPAGFSVTWTPVRAHT